MKLKECMPEHLDITYVDGKVEYSVHTIVYIVMHIAGIQKTLNVIKLALKMK